jgi:hypothetical protein
MSYTRRVRGLYALVVMAACGGNDAKQDAAIDATVARCDATAPFKAPIALTNLDSVRDDACARRTADELTIVFCRAAADGTWDLFSSTRSSAIDPFGAPQIMGAINSIYSDLWPALSADGLTLYFNSDRITPGTYKVYSSHRTTLQSQFQTPDVETALADNDDQPYVTNDGTGLYFSSSVRTGAGLTDIFRAPRMASGAIGVPVAVIGGVDTTADELAPVISGDELHMYFCRRTLMADPCEIYTATRSAVSDGFGASTPLDGFTDPAINNVPSWVSPDGCHLYLYSNQAGGMGASDLYELTRE